MKISRLWIVFAGITAITATAVGQSKDSTYTFEEDIAPLIKRSCMPCHLEENENPSGLSMDTFAMIQKGGKNGNPIKPGKPDESNMYLKLLPDPPFGKQMPRTRKKLTEEEVRMIYDWIKQGAKER